MKDPTSREDHTLAVAGVQMASRPGDVESNLAAAARLAREGREAGARLIAFPELFPTGYDRRAVESTPPAQASQGVLAWAGKLARELDAFLVVPFPEWAGGRVFNASALVAPGGELQGIYRKTCLYGWERDVFQPGAEFPLFQVDGFAVGLLICYDAEFPEPARKLALQGAELLVVPSVWSRGAGWRWAVQLPARALDNTVYLLGVNAAGGETCGGSLFLGPDGRPRAQLDTCGEGVVTGRVSRAELARWRSHVPYLDDLKSQQVRC